MRRLAISVAALAGCLAGAPAAGAAPYVVTLADGASVDAVVRGARLPAPKFRYDTALTGFAAELSGLQLDRVLADPAVVSVEPDAEIRAMGMQARAAGETAPPGIRRTGGATASLAHAPATSAVRSRSRRPRASPAGPPPCRPAVPGAARIRRSRR